MSNTHPHNAKSIFLSCIDDRLVAADAQFADSIGTAFHPRLAGGGLALLDPATRAVAMQQLAIPYVLAGVTEVYLESHTGCGAYKLAGVTFDSDADEIDRLYQDLDDAADDARAALLEAGAAEETVVVHTRVVDPAGALQERV
jgi:carbonic anhydrase